MRILVIDDDTELCVMLDELLRDAGFAPDFAHNATVGLQKALGGAYELLVLDVMLPDSDGLTLLKDLRRTSALPVLMLTARGQNADRVAGLNLGADDYLPKPFDPDEFVARIHAILRRTKYQAVNQTDLIQVGELRLVPAKREAFLAGKRIEITSMQFEVLELLLRSAGQVISRDEVAMQLYHRLSSPYERAVDVHIFHLRQKLQHYGQYIISVRGVGYQFCPPSGGLLTK